MSRRSWLFYFRRNRPRDEGVSSIRFFCRKFDKKCDETVNRVDSGPIFPTKIEIKTGAAKHRPRMGSGSAARAVLFEQVFSAIHALGVESQKMQTFDILSKSCKF